MQTCNKHSKVPEDIMQACSKYSKMPKDKMQACSKHSFHLCRSQINLDTFSNSVDSDGTACNELATGSTLFAILLCIFG